MFSQCLGLVWKNLSSLYHCSNLLEKTTDAVIKAAKTGNFIMVCISNYI